MVLEWGDKLRGLLMPTLKLVPSQILWGKYQSSLVLKYCINCVYGSVLYVRIACKVT